DWLRAGGARRQDARAGRRNWPRRADYSRGTRPGPGRPGGSFLKLPLQGLDLLGQARVVANEILDLAHRVQDRGVVASAEPPADLRQRPQGQCLRQVHGELPGADHICGPARRQKVATADVVVASDDALDVLDLDPLGLLRPDQVADLALG